MRAGEHKQSVWPEGVRNENIMFIYDLCCIWASDMAQAMCHLRTMRSQQQQQQRVQRRACGPHERCGGMLRLLFAIGGFRHVLFMIGTIASLHYSIVKMYCSMIRILYLFSSRVINCKFIETPKPRDRPPPSRFIAKGELNRRSGLPVCLCICMFSSVPRSRPFVYNQSVSTTKLSLSSTMASSPVRCCA